jgi:hypothetical protein
MDDEDRLDFVVDWPVNESILGQLRDYVQSHDLTATESSLWGDLDSLLEAQRPLMQRMGIRLGSDPPGRETNGDIRAAYPASTVMPIRVMTSSRGCSPYASCSVREMISSCVALPSSVK